MDMSAMIPAGKKGKYLLVGGALLIVMGVVVYLKSKSMVTQTAVTSTGAAPDYVDQPQATGGVDIYSIVANARQETLSEVQSMFTAYDQQTQSEINTLQGALLNLAEQSGQADTAMQQALSEALAAQAPNVNQTLTEYAAQQSGNLNQVISAMQQQQQATASNFAQLATNDMQITSGITQALSQITQPVAPQPAQVYTPVTTYTPPVSTPAPAPAPAPTANPLAGQIAAAQQLAALGDAYATATSAQRTAIRQQADAIRAAQGWVAGPSGGMSAVPDTVMVAAGLDPNRK